MKTINEKNLEGFLSEEQLFVQLPLMLRLTMTNKSAFAAAVKQGYIELGEDGYLEWKLGGKTLLAYFLGRLFCGDNSAYSTRKSGMVWTPGKGVFPGAQLAHLFNAPSLKIIRKRRSYGQLPEHFELIDILF